MRNNIRKIEGFENREEHINYICSESDRAYKIKEELENKKCYLRSEIRELQKAIYFNESIEVIKIKIRIKLKKFLKKFLSINK